MACQNNQKVKKCPIGMFVLIIKECRFIYSSKTISLNESIFT
jgi:hypothetical protein